MTRSTLAVATDDGKPALRFYEPGTGEDLFTIDMPEPIAAMTADRNRDRIVLRFESGAIASFDVNERKIVWTKEGDFRDAARIFAGGIWLSDSHRRLMRFDDAGFGIIVSDQTLAAAVAPGRVGGDLVAILEGGRLLVISANGQRRVVGDLPAPVAKLATGRVHDGGVDRALIALRDGSFAAVDLQTGKLIESFRASSGKAAQPIVWHDRLVLGCADEVGTLETYRD